MVVLLDGTTRAHRRMDIREPRKYLKITQGRCTSPIHLVA